MATQCVQCFGPLKRKAEFMALRPDPRDPKRTSEIWLCGSVQCDRDFENRVVPRKIK